MPLLSPPLYPPKVLPTFRMRVMNPTNGALLEPHQTGELEVRGPGVMLGYLDNPEANARAFTEDGWLKTGDIGHVTEEGTVFISDRLKELIKVKGLQVAPAELEDVLRGLQGVLDVAVVGVEDPRAGQLPRVFIVRAPALTEDKVRAFMSERLSPHKQPGGGVVFLQEIPKSAAGKILRRQLVDL